MKPLFELRVRGQANGMTRNVEQKIEELQVIKRERITHPEKAVLKSKLV